MTDTNHPITPPPGLIEDWIELSRPSAVGYADPNELATLAARWGSDQELDACCEWVSQFNYDDYSYQERLRAARRRPKPLSLKEQALKEMDKLDEMWDVTSIEDESLDIIRRALESLSD